MDFAFDVALKILSRIFKSSLNLLAQQMPTEVREPPFLSKCSYHPLTKEASLCSKRRPSQQTTTGHRVEITGLWEDHHKGYIYIIAPKSMAQGTWQERGQENGTSQNTRKSVVK